MIDNSLNSVKIYKMIYGEEFRDQEGRAEINAAQAEAARQMVQPICVVVIDAANNILELTRRQDVSTQKQLELEDAPENARYQTYTTIGMTKIPMREGKLRDAVSCMLTRDKLFGDEPDDRIMIHIPVPDDFDLYGEEPIPHSDEVYIEFIPNPLDHAPSVKYLVIPEGIFPYSLDPEGPDKIGEELSTEAIMRGLKDRMPKDLARISEIHSRLGDLTVTAQLETSFTDPETHDPNLSPED